MQGPFRAVKWLHLTRTALSYDGECDLFLPWLSLLVCDLTWRCRRPQKYQNRKMLPVSNESVRCGYVHPRCLTLRMTGAHSHIRGLGLDDTLDARVVSQACFLVVAIGRSPLTAQCAGYGWPAPGTQSSWCNFEDDPGRENRWPCSSHCRSAWNG